MDIGNQGLRAQTHTQDSERDAQPSQEIMSVIDKHGEEEAVEVDVFLMESRGGHCRVFHETTQGAGYEMNRKRSHMRLTRCNQVECLAMRRRLTGRKKRKHTRHGQHASTISRRSTKTRKFTTRQLETSVSKSRRT